MYIKHRNWKNGFLLYSLGRNPEGRQRAYGVAKEIV